MELFSSGGCGSGLFHEYVRCQTQTSRSCVILITAAPLLPALGQAEGRSSRNWLCGEPINLPPHPPPHGTLQPIRDNLPHTPKATSPHGSHSPFDLEELPSQDSHSWRDSSVSPAPPAPPSVSLHQLAALFEYLPPCQPGSSRRAAPSLRLCLSGA